MSLTVEQIIIDAKKLAVRISDHENTADNLICEMESVCNQIANMKQYREEVEILNAQAKQKSHLQLIAGIPREDKHLRDMQNENKELRNTLEDHQNALELIMSKYRKQTASLLRLSKIDLTRLHNDKYPNIIVQQAEKISEMAAVMKTAVEMDEETELKQREEYQSLKKENATLRELINIANEYGSIRKSVGVDSKTVQTDPIDDSPKSQII